MVAVRHTHMQTTQLGPEEWISGLIEDKSLRQHLIKLSQASESIVNAHSDVKRSLGTTLLWRGREMIEILHLLGMDKDTLTAAQLYPLYCQNLLSEEDIKAKYGSTTLKLMNGVKDMAGLCQLNATLGAKADSNQVDKVRRMLLAMVDDFRCVIIKLAERICRLREITDETIEVKKRVATECTNIYAPLANRLGIGQLKWEIEDYTFRYQHYHIYRQIAKQLAEKRIDREQYIYDFTSELSRHIQAVGMQAQVQGRPKHIYSIWRKMQKKNLAFDELFDVRAVRIVTERLQDCYGALGVVHTHFKHLPSEFDDYIANPKPNGYQSIHTVILGPAGKTVEIQIRTQAMHEESELGVAAHWKYKEGSNSDKGYEAKIKWLRHLLEWQEEMSDSGEMLDELRSQVFDDRVYAFTPRGDVIDLPMGATPLDFAYHIHSEVGHRCTGAKVDGKIVPFTYQLKMGDQVDIITQPQATPSRNWLNPTLGFVASGRARAKINAWFRQQSRDKNLEAGRDIFEQECSKAGLKTKEIHPDVFKKFNVKNSDELYVGIGSGDLRINQIVNYIDARMNKPSAADQDEQALLKLQANEIKRAAKPPSSKDMVVVEGVDNLMTHLARCCQPMPGDLISGFITQGRGISVHRQDCEQFAELRHHAAERIIDAVWGQGLTGTYIQKIRVEALERSGLLSELTLRFATDKINILSMKSYFDRKRQKSMIDFELELHQPDLLQFTLDKIEQIQDVLQVKRLR